MYIYLIGIVFAVLILSIVLIKNIKTISIFNILGMIASVILTYKIGTEIKLQDTLSYLNNNIYIDSFSLIQLFIITTVSFIASTYSYKYINNELKENIISVNKAKIYYLLFVIFIISMVFLSISNNIMVTWIGLEATTLSTAFLIGFNSSKLSLEAAWKYVILCSIGLAIGLVGIILFITSIKGSSDYMLKWTYLSNNYYVLNKNIVKIAFTFIFVGIGTKVGFAPMHTWLSDGHSEAPSPISAMMSGILLNLALYVIVRFYIIVRKIDGLENLKYLFIIFGCISLIISTFSILKQTNYKRLLAFSSVENMGIISLGFGFGGMLGTYGALLHSIIHAYGKTLLFLTAGNILSAYKTKRINKIKCLIKTMPKNSFFLVLGILIITGTPPFASFFSEFKICTQGIINQNYFSSFILLLCLLLAFSGFIIIFVKIIFNKDNKEYKKLEKDNENIIPLVITLVFIIFVSLSFNNILNPILTKTVTIING